MEQYELLQDLPCADKGSIFIKKSENLILPDNKNIFNRSIMFLEEDNSYYLKMEEIKNFNKWFKKVKWEPKKDNKYYTIVLTDLLEILECDMAFDNFKDYFKNKKAINNYFQTHEEAEEKLNKIKEILNN